MIGTYTFSQGEEILSRSHNVITSEGKKIILRSFVTGMAMGNSLAVGVGTSTPSVADYRLQYQTGLTPIKTSGTDTNNNRIIFKGSLDPLLYTKIYEVGMYFGPAPLQLELYKFTSDQAWTGTPSFSAVNNRVGRESLVLAPTVSATAGTTLSTAVGLDLNAFNEDDDISLAYWVANAFSASITVRIGTDASNYWQHVIVAPPAGYRISVFSRSGMTKVGNPIWGGVQYVSVSTTSTAGGASAVHLDGLRIDDIDAANRGSILVSRSLPSDPKIKYDNKSIDIEYAVAMGIG